MIKKYGPWIFIGLGVIIIYFLFLKKNSVTVPYLVPKPMPVPTNSNGSSPQGDTSIGEQPNITGGVPFDPSAGNGNFHATWNEQGVFPSWSVSMPAGAKTNQQQGYWSLNPGGTGYFFTPQQPGDNMVLESQDK